MFARMKTGAWSQHADVNGRRWRERVFNCSNPPCTMICTLSRSRSSWYRAPDLRALQHFGWMEGWRASHPMANLLMLSPSSVCVKSLVWTVQPPLAEWIRQGQPAHTLPQRPPGAEGRHKGRKRDGRKQGTDWRETLRKGTGKGGENENRKGARAGKDKQDREAGPKPPLPSEAPPRRRGSNQKEGEGSALSRVVGRYPRERGAVGVSLMRATRYDFSQYLSLSLSLPLPFSGVGAADVM
eukprot:365990-Chlamydomonas_euryale.AAC.9